MITKLKYFEDSYLSRDSAVIMAAGKDEIGHFLVLDQTIFYPQGGGQPSDTGTISVNGTSISIHMVKTSGGDVRHYVDRESSDLVNAEVLCSIDPEKRLLHAKLHTAGHLISNIVEKLYPQCQAIKGHHFPEQSYVEFALRSFQPESVAVTVMQSELDRYIELDHMVSQKQVAGSQLDEFCPNLPYKLPVDQQVRLIRICELPYSPCGGTHVKSLLELKGLEITKHKIKGNSIKIYYSIRRS